MFPKVIGVCGKIASGKSYFSKLISKEFGYKHLDCDKIFKDQLLTDEHFRKSLQKFFKRFGVIAFDESGEYNNKDIVGFIFSNTNIMDEFNQITRTFLNPILINEIKNSEKVLIEMAMLEGNPIQYLCDEIFYISSTNITFEQVLNTCKKRNPNVNVGIVHYIFGYQDREFPSMFKPYTKVIVNEFENTNNENLIEQFKRFINEY